jgi:hypothetical protein
MNRVDDLGGVNSPQVGAGDAEVRVPSLALDDRQGHTFPGHVNRIGVAKLVRSESPANAGLRGKTS